MSKKHSLSLSPDLRVFHREQPKDVINHSIPASSGLMDLNNSFEEGDLSEHSREFLGYPVPDAFVPVETSRDQLLTGQNGSWSPLLPVNPLALPRGAAPLCIGSLNANKMVTKCTSVAQPLGKFSNFFGPQFSAI